MEIIILSQREAVAYQPEKGVRTAIIRIHEPMESVIPLKHESLFVDELYVFFHDVHENMNNLPDDIKMMSTLDAKRIIRFVERHQDLDVVIIHCQAGVSRSASVGLALSWLLKLEEEEHKLLNSKYFSFNQRVLNVFADLLGIQKEKEKIFAEIRQKMIDGAKKEPFSW